MHREDRVARVLVEEAVLHHPQRAAAALLGRLEDQVERAGEAAAVREMVRRGEQHRRVAVVAAGVHHALVAAGVGKAGLFVDRQRVHVGAQAELALAVAAPKASDDARAAESAFDLVAPFAELGRHQFRGAVLVESQFGVVVDVTTQADEFIRLFVQFVEQSRGRHGIPYCGWRLMVLAMAR